MGSIKAFENFQARRNAKIEFIGYVPGDEQIAVTIYKLIRSSLWFFLARQTEHTIRSI